MSDFALGNPLNLPLARVHNRPLMTEYANNEKRPVFVLSESSKCACDLHFETIIAARG